MKLDVQCNIEDMGSLKLEWSTEYWSSSNPWVARGTASSNANYNVQSRTAITKPINDAVSFRRNIIYKEFIVIDIKNSKDVKKQDYL